MAHKDHEKMIGSYKSEVGQGGAITPGMSGLFVLIFKENLNMNMRLQRKEI